MEIYENLFQGNAESEPEPETPEFEAFQPLNDLVLVTAYNEDNSKAGSFIVPEKWRKQSNRGIVVSVGHLCESNLVAGDLITFGIGNHEDIVIHGVEHKLIRENDIRGVERAL